MIKKYILAILFLLVSMSPVFSQDLTKIGSDDLKSLLNDSSDKLHIVNFWATWCSPCVTELPYFEEAAQKFEGEDVEVTLISLDFPSQVESRLVPFLEEKKITLKVLLMEELDYDKWIPEVDETWKGNLPATLIFNNAKGKRQFVSRVLEKEELMKLIENNIN